MRSVAESVNPKPPRIPSFAIRSVTDQSRAKQRCNLDVIVTIRQMETESRIRDGKLGVTAIDGATGKAGIIAKILSAGSAIRAIAVGPAKPRDSHPISDCEVRISFADFFDSSDNLVTENQRQFRIGQFAIDHMKVSAANRAGANTDEQLSPARLRLWHITQLQGSFRFVENHGTHGYFPLTLTLTLRRTDGLRA